jgi:hypothetical protein
MEGIFAGNKLNDVKKLRKGKNSKIQRQVSFISLG